MASEGVRTCVVFGGSGRLGRALCEALSLGEPRARVGFTYFQGEAAAAELKERVPGIAARRVDLADAEALRCASDELAEELGGVDAFLHAAAVGTTLEPGGFDKIQSIDAAAWDRLMAVNVRSAFLGIKALLPRLSASRGNIVLVGSIDSLRPMPAPVHYAGSKGALRAMVHALSKELGPSGVKINMVAPGMLEGGLSRTIPGDLRDEYIKHCGLGRTGRFEEVAALCAHLALCNTYMTGQVLALDGAL